MTHIWPRQLARCTDMVCILLWAGFMTSLAIIWAYAASYADLRRISHRFNYRGELCGADLAVLDKPFLYWCAGIEDGSHTTLAMNYENPICVERCPTEGDPLEMLPCPMPARVDIVRTGDAPYTGNTTTITQVVVPQRGLDTVPLAGRYCIPKDTFLSKQVLRGPLLEQPQQAIDYLLELKNASKDVAAGLLAAILTSYGYIILLRNNAKLVATASLAGLVIASVAFGIACLRNTTTAANANPRLLSRIVGILCFALAFGCMLVSYKAQEAFRLGSAYAQETCKVVFSVPSLFLYPMVDASIKVTVAGILGRGFLWLVASGSVNTERALINGHEITDSHRTFAYSGKELCMMVYWLAATLWVFEFLMALSHFAVSYATMLYYFAPTEISGERQIPRLSTYRGLLSGLVYHTGTIAWGSLLTMILRPLRILFFLVEWALDGPTNTVITSSLAKRLSYSLKFHRRFLKFICGDAYIDVAFNSSSFLAAGANAFKVMHTDNQLSRTILMFQCVGVVLSAVFGGYVAYVVTTCDATMMNSQHERFVSSTEKLVKTSKPNAEAKRNISG